MNDLDTATDRGEELHRRLERFVGMTSGAPRLAPDPVNVPMIRHWCLALGDANPAYTDDEVASRTQFGRIIAPPLMIQSWTHHDRRFPPSLADDNAEERVAAELIAEGFTGVVATGCHYRFQRPLYPGDRTTYQATIVSVSPLKKTSLGEGFFLVSEVIYRDQDDRVVGSIDFTTLRFRPAEAA